MIMAKRGKMILPFAVQKLSSMNTQKRYSIFQ